MTRSPLLSVTTVKRVSFDCSATMGLMLALKPPVPSPTTNISQMK